MNLSNTDITEQELNTKVSVLNFIEGTSVDGPGLRTSIYFAGCKHHCEGCHNPESWDFNAGKEYTVREILQIIEDNDFNVTFSGGDPLYQVENVTILAKCIKKILKKNIWCYTGYLIENIKSSAKLSNILEWIDVVVEGPFVLQLRDTSLIFKGSSNQRIIDIKTDTVIG